MAEKKNFTFEEIKQKMINYCVYQDRSHHEVEQKMREYFLIPEAKDKILLYLVQENFLNEERFTRSYVRGKFYIKKWGKNKIKMNLLQKGISEKLIIKSFNEIANEDYQKSIREFIIKMSNNNKGFKENQIKQKIIKNLLSKGYEYEVVVEEINSLGL